MSAITEDIPKNEFRKRGKKQMDALSYLFENEEEANFH